MHLFELTEEQGEYHDSGNDCELGRLKIDWPEMEPAARTVNFLPHEFGENQKKDAGQVHRQRPPSNPAVINQAREHESEKADHNPIDLLAPKIGGDRIFAHVGRAVDGDDAEDRERQHDNKQKPI